MARRAVWVPKATLPRGRQVPARNAGVAAAAEMAAAFPGFALSVAVCICVAVLTRFAVLSTLVLAVTVIAAAMLLLAALFSLAGLVLPVIREHGHDGDRAGQRQKKKRCFVHKTPRSSETGYLPAESGKFGPNLQRIREVGR